MRSFSIVRYSLLVTTRQLSCLLQRDTLASRAPCLNVWAKVYHGYCSIRITFRLRPNLSPRWQGEGQIFEARPPWGIP